MSKSGRILSMCVFVQWTKKEKKLFKFHSAFVWVTCQRWWSAGWNFVWTTAELTVVCQQTEQNNSNVGLGQIRVAVSFSQSRSESSVKIQQLNPHCAVVSLKVSGEVAQSRDLRANGEQITHLARRTWMKRRRGSVSTCVRVGVRSAHCRANYFQWHSGTWSLLLRQEAVTRWWEMSGKQVAQKVPVGHSEEKKKKEAEECWFRPSAAIP